MSGETFPKNHVQRSEKMKKSSYLKVMYCPIVSQVNGGSSVHNMGRSDYGLNRYFHAGANYDNFKKFSIAMQGGKTEPIIMPIQGPSNPSVWRSNVASATKNVAYYFGNHNKTVGLYVMGNVRYISIAEGTSIDPDIKNGSSLE
jgi:hypothetical protein